MKQILTTLLVLLFLFQNLNAGTIKIPSDQPTIQVGIVSSSNGDTILVSPGTYYENINFNGKNIVLGSLFLTTGDTSYISQTIIDGSQQGCVVVFESGEDSTATLTGFTITNGYSNLDSTRGGGITCINSSSPKLTNLIVTNNKVLGKYESYGGGGIYCLRQSSPLIENLLIKENRVEQGGSGGGIYCRDSSNIAMTNLIIRDNYNSGGNSDSGGGGIAIVKSQSTIVNSQIARNTTQMLGGGIFILNSRVEINNSSINENIAKGSNNVMGGGIYAGFSNVLIKESDISYNFANATYSPSSEGGGIFVISSSLQIENCNINNNTSIGSGGGITTDGSNTKIYSTSIKSNSTYGGIYKGGGGICSDSWYTSLKNVLSLEDVLISDNYSDGLGGGISFFPNEQIDVFKNVTIKNNRAGLKGGGLATNQNLLISESSGCSIFLNKANENGADIYMQIDDPNSTNEIYLDTVTVSIPNDYHVYPIQNIDFHYNHMIFESVNSDLYVSPTGSDENIGTLKDEPFKTISFALMVASADSTNRRTIYLSPGIYSSSTNGEEFPLIGRSYIAIKGERVDTTILDGENENIIIGLTNCNGVSFENFTIQNGYGWNGGGINLSGREILLKNIVIKDNLAERNGGGLYIYNSNQVDLVNLTISNNISNEPNSGGGISYLDTKLNGEKNISILNCIVHSNNPINLKLYSVPPDTTDAVLIGYSNIEDGQQGITNSNVVIHWLDGNIDTDPLFVGGNPFDYNLTDSSPCINAGTPFLVWEGDTLINLSPSEYIGEAPDMGALESDVLISVEGEETVPTQFKLDQNYPNPFNPSTTIKYSIPNVTHPSILSREGKERSDRGVLLTLKVYDILGRQVTTLVNKEQKPGNYEVKFDASALSSGVYLYKLQAGTYLKTRKMILLR